MALRIWCNPRYFPPETHRRVIGSVEAVLRLHGVTLEQVRAVQADADRGTDNADGDELAEGDPEWADVWFEAIELAEKDLGIEPTPLGAILVLEESDRRFGAILH